MASSPCNYWSHATNPPSPSLSSSDSRTPSSDRKSVEEVWKDLKLASLCDCSMDMVAPFNKHSSNADNLKQPQPTLLTLGASASVFQKQQSHLSLLSSVNTLFDASESPTIRPSTGEKSARQDIYDSSDPRYRRMMKNRESAVRSRARKQEISLSPLSDTSLCRKAYRKGLEMKLARLTEENSRLKRQVEQLKFCLSSAKPPKMGTLHRNTSSPF